METPGNKILIIDDIPLSLYVMEHVMRQCGLGNDIVTFSSAADALVYLKSVQNAPGEFPGYIFLDLHMPVFDGFDFLNEYESFSESLKQHSNIVVITAADSGQYYKRALDHPLVKKVLIKPLTCSIIADLLHQEHDCSLSA